METTTTECVHNYCTLDVRTRGRNKDTVDDTASLDVSTLREVKLDELPKTTGVVVVNRFSVPKRFHDRTARKTSTCDVSMAVHRDIDQPNHCHNIIRLDGRC